jgi:tRNA-dihydrouridine synthase
VKFRIGYQDDKIIAVEFAKMCEEAGAAAITVHGRTTSQGYAGKVDYETIRKVKEAVSIPVFANGDCRTKEDYENILKITGADGIAIGRGAVGKPEVFADMLGIDYEADKLKQIKFHYETLMEFFPEKYVVKYMRSHLAGYLSGKYKNSTALVSLLKMEKYSEIVEFLTKIMM